MRFMAIIKGTPESEKQAARPDPQFLAEMGKYNEELMKAGVLLAMDGLHPSSKGARVKFSGKSRTVTDGPFTESKELVAGFWILQVKSIEEAIEWIKRCPSGPDDYEVEIRQIGEMEDFAPVLTEEEIQHKIKRRAELPNQTVNKAS
jgi:hypothetical protein